MTKGKGYSAVQARALQSGLHELNGYGTIAWAPAQSAMQGETLIAEVTIQGMPEVGFFVNLRPMRLSEPTFFMKLGGMHLQRIDVNGMHQGHRYTHLQKSNPDHPEILLPAESLEETFPVLLRQPTVSDRDLQVCYRAAAKQFTIDVSGVEWTIPPIEGVLE